jgi:primosomal protein N'
VVERLKETLARVNVRATFSEARPAPIERIRDAYRYEVIMTFSGPNALLAGLDACRAENALTARTQGIVVDVDPVSMQ